MADLVPAAEIARITRLLGAPYANTFGATETGCPPCSSNLHPDRRRAGAPVEAAEPVLRGPAGRRRRPRRARRHAGRALHARPDAVQRLLARRRGRTRDDFRGGWFHMGDVFVRNPDGTLDFVDRVKYLIKTRRREHLPGGDRARAARGSARRRGGGRAPRRSRSGARCRSRSSRGRDRGARRAELLSRAAARSSPATSSRRRSCFIALDDFPRSASGKVQRHELETPAPTSLHDAPRPRDLRRPPRIATRPPDDVVVRGKSLCRELIGKLTFTEMIYFQITRRRMPTPAQTAVLDACLVTLMEHGLTPSAIATRLVYSQRARGDAGRGRGGAARRRQHVRRHDARAARALLARIVAAADDARAEARRDRAEHAQRAAAAGLRPSAPQARRSAHGRAARARARADGLAGTHIARARALSAAVDAGVRQAHHGQRDRRRRRGARRRRRPGPRSCAASR